MAAKYNVTPGQNFQVTGSNGITYNLIYMDTGAAWETGRVDIYCAAPRFFVGTGQVQRRIISWEVARGVRGNLTMGEP
jgi:hypothetical protein